MTAPAQPAPSAWQRQIAGDWHGVPSVFDADGVHVGHMKVSRASTAIDGGTLYTMATSIDVRGPLRARLEAGSFAFGVRDGERDRIYLGPDFVGAGQPCGDVVDAHYYAPGWQADLRTQVHVVTLPDGARRQVYSSLLHEGPTLVAVFNGLYRQGELTDPADAAAVDEFCAAERVAGARSHVLPFKHAGQWTGELVVHDHDGARIGVTAARIEHRPLSLLRAETTITLEGAVTARWRAVRSRVGDRHTWDGPDLWGNGRGYGRALYTSLHGFGQALRIRGRDFLIDDDHGLAVVWELYASGRRQTVYGHLGWEAGELVLGANLQGTAP